MYAWGIGTCIHFTARRSWNRTELCTLSCELRRSRDTTCLQSFASRLSLPRRCYLYIQDRALVSQVSRGQRPAEDATLSQSGPPTVHMPQSLPNTSSQRAKLSARRLQHTDDGQCRTPVVFILESFGKYQISRLRTVPNPPRASLHP